MDTLLTISGTLGFLSTGFVLGDFVHRWRSEKELTEATGSLKATLEKIQALHNSSVVTSQEMADRLGSLEMLVKTGAKR